MMNLEEIMEEIEKRANSVVTTDADKMPERIEAAEVILREDVPALIDEVKRLREELDSANDAIVLLKTRLKQLQKAVEIEHDQGESFLVQIKELQAENEYVRNWFQEHDDDIGLHNASIRLFAMAACCNADCGWEGLYRDCLVSKHNQTLVVCPECHEVVEIMESDNGYW